ncbi:hypothetical protein DFP72DRAFT_1073316 [Ephemerocybe angulata]|uniref:Uncharacterized protein n=1 Tax=Ephemerocybe angulata TaxID=980116 RepID=A0A8H6HMK4_9AGAR|nr:hypothetical protein DFP72DRAFT_1073316 [Tulosesus angulatus]
MDNSRCWGRQSVGGTMYYSPNAPSAGYTAFMEDLGSVDNPFQPEKTGRLRVQFPSFVGPREWSQEFGWLAFVPAWRWYEEGAGGILRELAHSPPVLHEVTAEGVHYYKAKSGRLKNLEDCLFKAVTALRGKYHTPCILPYLPHKVGYTRAFSKRSILERKLEEAQEWCLVWLGALSFLIAWAKAPGDLPEGFSHCYPEWRTVLREAGLGEGWIDDVLHSPVCDYSAASRRAGCIIRLCNPKAGQPDVLWFQKHGIPVWYAWGQSEVEAMRRNPRLAAFQPPANVQETITLGATSDVFSSVGSGRTMEGEWEAFFLGRALEQERRIKVETPAQRQARESRTREPPNQSAPVFEWFQCNDSPTGFRRTPVPSKLRAETLELYGPQQKRYDPVFNEWNCCFEFGDDGESEAGHAVLEECLGEGCRGRGTADEEGQDLGPNLGSGGVLEEAVSHMELDRPPIAFTAQGRMKWDGALPHEVEGVYCVHYGFSHSTVGETEVVGRDEGNGRERAVFLRLLGSGPWSRFEERDAYFETDHYAAVQAFVSSLARGGKDVGASWDVRDNSICPVRLTDRFTSIRVVQGGRYKGVADTNEKEDRYYVFSMKHKTVPWKLAVVSATVALMVCRLPPAFTEPDIVFFLGQLGIPFRIFHRYAKLPSVHVRHPVPQELPVRRYDHIFTKADYDAYVRMKTLILGQTHMQAALRRGGIIWRLAIGILGCSRLIEPPSQWGAVQDVEISGATYVEDILTTIEMDLLCGAYECVSEDGKKRALKSWWPLNRYYEKEECGENYGRWTGRREDWYQKRVECIETSDTGMGQPLTYTKWKSTQHGVPAIRAFHRALEVGSKRLFE